jgi:flagellar protein FliL
MPTETRYGSRSAAILISRWLLAFACVALFAMSVSAAEPAEKSAHAPIAGAPVYVRLDSIFVPVIEGSQVTHQIGITLMLQLAENQDKSDVESKRKPLYDALFRDLYGYFQDRVVASGHVDQPYLKVRLLKTTARIVGPNLVKEVLIEQLFERPK